MPDKKLELYFQPNCTHCTRVIYFMTKNNIEVEYKSIEEGYNQYELKQRADGQGLPCLFVDGEPLDESTDIIAYLTELFGL